MTSSVTLEEVRRDCPTVWVECAGKRQMAGTADQDGKACVTVTDNATLSKIKGDGTFLIPWEDIVEAINSHRPLFIACEEQDAPKP